LLQGTPLAPMSRTVSPKQDKVLKVSSSVTKLHKNEFSLPTKSHLRTFNRPKKLLSTMVSKSITQHSQATEKYKPHSKTSLGRLMYKLNAIEQRRPSLHEWCRCLDSVVVERQAGVVPPSSPRKRRVRFHDSPNTSVDDDTSNIILGLSAPPQRRSFKKPRRNSFVIRNLPRASALSMMMGLSSLSQDQSDFSAAEQKTTLKQTSSTSLLQSYVTSMALGDE
jgi:hypothetical protein